LAHGRKTSSNQRGNHKRGINRYDPNNPSYAAVHGPDYMRRVNLSAMVTRAMFRRPIVGAVASGKTPVA
jgi:hypothetical protein